MPAVMKSRRSTLPILRRVLVLPGLLATLIGLGTLGFRHFSHGSWVDCLYMAVTTITTVGYGEIVPLGPDGRLFVIGFLLIAFGVVSYSAFQIGQWIFSAQIQQLLERRHMENQVKHLKNHSIVCG